MSYIMHTKREQCLDFIKRFLKQNPKTSINNMKVEIMRRFNFASQTADRYIRDIIEMGIAKTNDNTLLYIPLKGEEKKEEEKEAQ